ncbi:sensor histidine kinase [Mesobacillus maritimus]|uniref:histidine kinase n=1 Tax=Mesobacillus maritimus TaxID=1643336 RepID=A0ABS7K9B6_9BACI|nr:ATP-binding protein [Mesobacillus maritimus]MBY0098869.1 HAMP domain-containing histidine kinase [Mesobacillus maritimus]
MKLKTWLLVSYFIVMLLPLAAAYLLFAWIQSYNDEQKVEEYFLASMQIQNITSTLDDPTLFKPGIELPQVEQLDGEDISVALYNKDGIVLFSSDKTVIPSQFALGKEELYKNLYSLEQGYRVYRYKQPVLSENGIVGFFEIQIARDEWMAGVANRSWIMIGMFIGIFFLIFLTVAILVNRKLNSRLTSLMNQMTAFANQESIAEIPTNKDEIGELTTHFYHMRKQIETARKTIEKEQQEKEYMIATISHDLKTPLTSISAYAESLFSEQDLNGEEREEYRQIIVDKAHFMKQMIDDLLMYTLLQSARYEMELVEVEGDEFFEMLISDYEPLCQKKRINLSVHCDVTGNYQVNPKQLMRVTDNLMSNAIQHTDFEGEIWIGAVSSAATNPPNWVFDFIKKQELLRHPQSVYLIVQNAGKGIPVEQMVHVFDPLFQADQARSKKDAQGTGLGLSITKQIIEKHGGDVQLFSEAEIGTCVICRLPMLERKGE